MGVPFGMSNVNIGGLDLCAADGDLGVDFGVTTLDGWEGAPAASLEVQTRVRAHGGIGGDSFSGPRHITVGGWIRARDPRRMLPAKDALLAAFALDGRLLTVTEVGVPRWCVVRREDEPIITRRSLFHAEFSIQCVAEDWRKLGRELSGETRLPSSVGGFVYPHAYPYVIGATMISGQVSLTNEGSTAGPVRVRIDGPVTGPIITHRGGGRVRQLAFAPSLVLTSGEWIDVDMESHHVLAGGQVSRSGWVTSRGWSVFEPGVNVWSLTAAEHDDESRLTVFATEAWE